MSRKDVVAHVRRSSDGFSRGASRFRGVTRHHGNGNWEARIGKINNRRYVVGGAG
jgi:AP2-like factor (ANT lineage)